MDVIEASKREMARITEFALMLWPDHTFKELYEELAKVLASDSGTIFMVKKDREWIGFAQCQLRFDYVEGTSSTPVGYLEGVYVLSAYRKQGAARLLVQACEQWSKKKGCSEFASDCELDNIESYEFHKKIGFIGESKLICFAKKI